MSEWWTYGLSDFLMFSPEAYWRLVARFNAAWWPGQLPAPAAGAAMLAVLVRGKSPRLVLLVLAAAWAWVGWAFHWQQYSEIFLAAGWTAAACAVQAVALLAAAALPFAGDAPPGRLHWAGIALVILALLFPLLAVASSRGWPSAEVFGFMPDPTALATLGTLLCLHGTSRAARALLAIVPVLVLLLGLALRWQLA